MVNEDEILGRIKACAAEIALRHGREMSPELRAEVIEACSEILAEYECADNRVILDPIQKDGTVTVWIGDLPKPEIVPDPDREGS